MSETATRTHTVFSPRWSRPAAGFCGVGALLATFWATKAFALWVSLHDSIYLPAVEVGKEPSYPSGHTEFGVLAASATTVCAALTLLCFAYAAGAQRRPIRHPLQALALIAGSLIIGAAIPVTGLFTLLGLVPLSAGLGLFVAALLWPRPVQGG